VLRDSSRATFLLAASVALAGCPSAAPPVTPAAAPVTVSIEQQREAVSARLAVKLDADPNRPLCDRLVRRFGEGDHDALRPVFDASRFVERILAHRPLPPATAARLRAGAAGYVKFARVLTPPGSTFRCLGTRSFLGAPHVVIRQWTPARHDYVLLKVGPDAAHPIEDWLVASNGAYHSEAQSLAFDPALVAEMEKIGAMFQMSYDQNFAGVIASYRTMPADLQASPSAFMHFINAVYNSAPPTSPLYAEATSRLATVLGGRDIALAYWQLSDAERRNDEPLRERSRARLLELLDDYELLAARASP
jgi:hypothetical protein